MQVPLVSVTLAFLSGILLGEHTAPHPGGLVLAGGLSAWAILCDRRGAKAWLAALLLLWGCLGALRMAVWERHPDTGLKAILSEEPQPVRLHGRVVDDPVELFEPGETHVAEDDARTGQERQVCVLELRDRETTHGWQPIHGRLRATILSPRALVRYGDEVLVEGAWSCVPSPSNPGQYDWRASLARKRIHGLLRVRPYDGLVVLRQRQGNPVLAVVFRLRHRWEQLIREHFSPRDAGLLLGLLLGQRAEIDEDLKAAFIETGTMQSLATQCTKLHRDSFAGDATL